MRIDEKLVIDLVDLDHILDIDILEGNRDNAPSELFLQMLQDELDLSGLNLKENEAPKFIIEYESGDEYYYDDTEIINHLITKHGFYKAEYQASLFTD